MTRDAAAVIYAGRDPRDIPAYSLHEASRYLRLPPATLRSWVVGRPYPKRGGPGFFEPLISLADPQAKQLSFWNLVEAHVLRALRVSEHSSIPEIRASLDYAAEHLGIPRVLLSEDLRTHANEILLDHYGQLISLSRSGQLAMRKVMEACLRRVVWENKLPARLHPFLVNTTDSDTTTAIAIDPYISFGRPIVRRRGIATAAIVDRIDAGETPLEVARDYGLEEHEVEQAVLYESFQKAA